MDGAAELRGLGALRRERLAALHGEPELHPLARLVGVASRQLAQALHPVAERVAVDAEPLGGVAPAAAGLEQRRERLDEPRPPERGAEHSLDERLERGRRKPEQELERAEVAVRRDGAFARLERGARLEQRASEPGGDGRAPDPEARLGQRRGELVREREDRLFVLGGDEERRPVTPRCGEIGDAARFELVRDRRAGRLGRRPLRAERHERGVGAVGAEAEGTDPPRELALLEPALLEVVEEVAGEPELRVRHRVPARELERKRRLAVVEHQPVVLAELAARLRRAQRRKLAGGGHRQLEAVAEREPAAPMQLSHDAPLAVDELERAVEMLAERGEERLHALTREHRLRKPLVHRERTRQPLELVAREPRRGRLRDRDERHLVRDRDDWEAAPLRLVDDRLRHPVVAEAGAEAEAGDAVCGEAADVLPLRPRRLPDPEAGREEELAALEPRRRVRQLAQMEPADLVVEPGGAARDREPEPRQL